MRTYDKVSSQQKKMNIIYDTRKFKKDLVHSVGHFLTTSSSFLLLFFSFLQLICHDPLH